MTDPSEAICLAVDITELLALEELDTALFRGTLAPHGHHGGHVMAQAARSAGLTVGADRELHSLHGYFLRRGDASRPIVYRVELDRDGRSFSARRVIALQASEPIFTASMSFHLPEPSGEYQIAMPVGMADPEMAPADTGQRAGPTDFFDVRWATTEPGGNEGVPSRVWVRTRTPLDDDWAVHASALAYISDFGSGFGEVAVEGLARAGPSLDHGMWFHHPIRADEWVLLDMWPLRASNGRGTYMGTIHAQDGTLGATFAQEALLRPRGQRHSQG